MVPAKSSALTFFAILVRYLYITPKTLIWGASVDFKFFLQMIQIIGKTTMAQTPVVFKKIDIWCYWTSASFSTIHPIQNCRALTMILGDTNAKISHRGFSKQKKTCRKRYRLKKVVNNQSKINFTY